MRFRLVTLCHDWMVLVTAFIIDASLCLGLSGIPVVAGHRAKTRAVIWFYTRSQIQ